MSEIDLCFVIVVGYSDGNAFREVFRKITGISPLEYRNKYNKEAVVL
jgi:YesN/AraC family two-component response regulator